MLTLGVGAVNVNNPAKYELSNLNAPATGTVGTPMQVTADLKNSGGADGTASVSLIVNGANVDSRSIAVAHGATEHLAFTFTPSAAGTFNVTVKLADGTTLASKQITVNTPTGTTTTSSTTSTTTTT